MDMKGLYIIPEKNCIEESMALAKEYGAFFEYNDFFSPVLLDDAKQREELLTFYCQLPRDRSRDILHGAFLDVTVHSEDPSIRKVSEYRVRQSMDIAARLGIRGVVFHTNYIPNFEIPSYMQHWVESNEAFWRQILGEYPKLEIFIENMFDQKPDLLSQLADRMKEEPRFGVCLDYGHAIVFGDEKKSAIWAEKLLPFARHMHINDNDRKHDLHQIVGAGCIDWFVYNEYIKEYIKEYDIPCSVLVEVRGIDSQRASLEYMKKHGLYPFSR